MTRSTNALYLAVVVAAAVPVWAHAEARHTHAGAAAVRVAYASPHHHQTQGLRPMRSVPRAVVHPAARPVMRPVITSYGPRPAYFAPRVVVVPAPYYVFADTGYGAATPAFQPEPAWNWTPVASVASLAGRGEVRLYCPDTRTYYPQVETCPSPWLKVIP